ncbi:MAG TPA: hypothetical protein VFL86_28830 [Burkholderiaceae bacterium]|nr:hypothetical protein [Burkholderiaceae bacterium]
MPHFYATAADLLPVFASVESKLSLRCTLADHVDSISIKSFQSGAAKQAQGVQVRVAGAGLGVLALRG